ncbi:MAG: hypothetical protein ACW963_02605 [Candidatus Sifarchaeia archaeon]
MDELEEIDPGTFADACHRGVIESIVVPLIHHYKTIPHMKFQWPFETKQELDYTKCAIEYYAIIITLTCVGTVLKVLVYEPNAVSYTQGMHQPFFVNSYKETEFQIADPEIDRKGIEFISNKLNKYIGAKHEMES